MRIHRCRYCKSEYAAGVNAKGIYLGVESARKDHYAHCKLAQIAIEKERVELEAIQRQIDKWEREDLAWAILREMHI